MRADSPEHVPRVLFAIGGLQIGGSEGQLVELLTRIHPERVEATVVTWDSDAHPDHERRLQEAGVSHLHLGNLSGPRILRPPAAVSRLARIVRALRPHAVYPWLEQAAALLTPVARAHRIPVVVARRNTCGAGVEQGNPLAAIAIRSIERTATLVTGNSLAVIDAARRRGIPVERLRLVPNGHPDDAPLPFPANGPVAIGYVAGFRREKGHLRLLDALGALRTRIEWRVDLAGDGPLMSTVAREVDRRGLAERVRFVGAIRDVRAFWAERSIAMLLSDYEGSPNALIEAAFAGRPLLGTNVAGIPEVVAPSGGMLVPRHDASATAAALARLLEDDELRRRLGADAHRQALERFDVGRFVEGHLGAILEALGPAPAAPEESR